jgi:hypothetical protein
VDEKPWREVPCDLHRLAKLLTSTILEIPVGRYLIALHQATGGERLGGAGRSRGSISTKCSSVCGSMTTVGGGEGLIAVVTGGIVSVTSERGQARLGHGVVTVLGARMCGRVRGPRTHGEAEA